VVFLNPEKKFVEDSCCRLREKRKNRLTPTHSNSAKWRHRAEGYANNQPRSVSATICKQFVQK